jgi:hypothetical protein
LEGERVELITKDIHKLYISISSVRVNAINLRKIFMVFLSPTGNMLKYVKISHDF